MNVCLVMGGDEEGGLETHVVDLANGLAALGDTVTVIAHARYAGRFRAGVRHLPLHLTRGRRNLLLRRRLGLAIRDAAPDVVHAHAGKAAALLASVRPRAATVGTVHGTKRNLAAYRRLDAVIGVSPAVVEHLDHPVTHVVYNGVRPAPTAISRAELRRRFGMPPAATVTLAVGRLVPVKGYDRLVAEWDPALGHLLIAGEGPERNRLRRLAAGKPVTLAGFHPDVRTWLPAADVMVFASAREGFSYALAEALLARLPVVSTPVSGAAGLLPAEHLAQPGRLTEAIAACLADPAAARARMRDAFDWAGETLTVEHMVRATRAVYDEVVA